MQEVKEKPGRWKRRLKLHRRNEVVINRLRLEYTNVTHGCRFDSTGLGQPPICHWCDDAVLTVRHVLIECPNLAIYSDFYLETENMPVTMQAALGEESSVVEVIEYLKGIDLYKI